MFSISLDLSKVFQCFAQLAIFWLKSNLLKSLLSPASKCKSKIPCSKNCLLSQPNDYFFSSLDPFLCFWVSLTTIPTITLEIILSFSNIIIPTMGAFLDIVFFYIFFCPISIGVFHVGVHMLRLSIHLIFQSYNMTMVSNSNQTYYNSPNAKSQIDINV